MRRSLCVAVLLMILSALACNSPRPATPQAVCTPPPCAEGQVYYCAGECPGGCGTQCADPTALPPTEESPTTASLTKTPFVTVTPLPIGTPLPTYTPFPVCTPPPCTEDQVYYCPGECPGGCGTLCAIPTPPPSAPVILSFTADHSAIVEGESVTLAWQATGGSEAVVQWVTREAILAQAPGPLNPDGGTVTIMPDGSGDITLIVRNSAGTVEAHVQVEIACPYPWTEALTAAPPLASGCPLEAVFGDAAQQSFENGFMVWLGAEQMVYVFYNAQGGSPATFETYIDNFHDRDPESDPTLVPPAGLYQPVRGFGLVWRLDPSISKRLGWATDPEEGFQTWTQGYSGTGLHSFYALMQGIDGTIYHLRMMGNAWEVYSP